MTIRRYDGTRTATFGFRFVYRGRQYQRKGFPNRSLAKEAERRERQRVQQGAFEMRWGPLTPKLTTWEDAVAAYTQAKTDKMDLVEHDVPRLGWWGRFFASQGIHHLQAVTPDAIDRAKHALKRAGRTPSTIQRYLAVLRHLFQLAIRRWQLVDRNPVFAVDWPRAAPYHARIPSRVERQRLLAAAEPFLRPLILIGMYTGLRKGSILRLAAENYLNEPGILRVIQKGGRELKLPMTPPLKKVFDGLGIAAGPLFRWPDGRIMHRFPRKAWARACVKAELYVEKPDPQHPRKPRRVPAIRFHDLRHCMGTVLAEAGVEQRLIQELLGHSGIRISERYTRPRRPALRRAALKATRLMGVEPSV